MPMTAGAIFSLTLCDGLQGAFAEVARFVAVAQFDGFVFAGGCAGGDGGAADGAVREEDVDFDGGIAAGVEDLPPDGFYYFHKPPLYRDGRNAADAPRALGMMGDGTNA